jgi:hypothetical protein
MSDSAAPRPEPPVKQLEDVPEEEWTYWSAQAWAGCGVIAALMLAMFLPLTLTVFMDDRLAKLVGFGAAGALALVSVAIISRLTYRKRQERRETLRLVLDRRPRPTDGESGGAP